MFPSDQNSGSDPGLSLREFGEGDRAKRGRVGTTDTAKQGKKEPHPVLPEVGPKSGREKTTQDCGGVNPEAL
jgi:hypothetical protein